MAPNAAPIIMNIISIKKAKKTVNNKDSIFVKSKLGSIFKPIGNIKPINEHEIINTFVRFIKLDK